jgi:hypothetical protein
MNYLVLCLKIKKEIEMFFLPTNKRSHTFIIFALSIIITLESYLFSFAQMSPNLRARSNPSPQTSTLVVEPETKPNSESVTQNTEVKKSETQAQTNNSELRIPNSELNKMPVNQQTQVAPVTPQTVASDLNGSIQRLLLLNERKRPSVADCSPFAVLSYCFPYGSQAMVMTGNRDNPLIYAVGAICWNVPCNGKVLFQVSGDRVIARVGQDYQPAPGAF